VVRSQSRSLAMSPLDSVHMISYSTLIEINVKKLTSLKLGVRTTW